MIHANAILSARNFTKVYIYLKVARASSRTNL